MRLQQSLSCFIDVIAVDLVFDNVGLEYWGLHSQEAENRRNNYVDFQFYIAISKEVPFFLTHSLTIFTSMRDHITLVLSPCSSFFFFLPSFFTRAISRLFDKLSCCRFFSRSISSSEMSELGTVILDLFLGLPFCTESGQNVYIIYLWWVMVIVHITRAASIWRIPRFHEGR